MLTLLIRDEELCRFGASSYLYYGGVFSLVVNLLGLASSLAKWFGQYIKMEPFLSCFSKPGGLWRMARSVSVRGGCSGSWASPPPSCSWLTSSSSSGWMNTYSLFVFSLCMHSGFSGGVQQLRLVELHGHNLSQLLRSHSYALCLRLATCKLVNVIILIFSTNPSQGVANKNFQTF